MKIIALAVTMAFIAGTAFAHTSVVPHEHPHGLNWLPDVGALLIAAVLVGAGVFAFRRFRKS
jgi:flagellar biogenesis protein FliO